MRDVRDAKALIRDPLLRERLKEITGVAERHLASGTKPEILFGSRVDVEKFHECASLRDATNITKGIAFY